MASGSLSGKVPGAVEIWYEAVGVTTDPVVVLIMGQGGDASAWDDEFCSAVLAAGYRVVRFDNRDSGLSDDTDGRYTLVDLSADTVRVLDHLEISRAHLVGQSMGGLIAQRVAIDHPDRVCSMALLSTSPDVRIALPEEVMSEVADSVMQPTAVTPEDWVELAVESLRLQTGPRWGFDEALVRSRVEACVRRALRPEAGARQVKAVLASPPNTEDLRNVEVPTLIIHGTHDPVFPLAHAQVLAEAIPNSWLVVVDGMGHAVPWGHWDVVLGPLLDHLGSVR